MVSDNQRKLEQRVVRAAEAALVERRFVTAVDVLVGIGWLAPSAVDRWRHGRVDHLEREVQANLHNISTAMAAFRRWAEQRGLKPSETAYVARTRDRRPLLFSASGNSDIERAYRTHWVSPELSEAERERLAESQGRPPDLVVVQALEEWTCTECTRTGELLIMEDPGPLCMACADLDHLVYLPSGNAALTRRAKKASQLSAVVVRFSRARRRYERQGVLVEEDALSRAEQECLADEEARRLRQQREAEHRAAQDGELQAALGREITRLFPGCPPDRAGAIARHAAARGSGRIGRTAAGRALEPEAVTLAVVAAVRHGETAYDELLMTGLSRTEARQRVHPDVQRLLDTWRSTTPG
jgi:hypothetical protein